MLAQKADRMPDGLNVSPTSILSKAIKAVPAVKYALGIGGIVAVIAIVVGGFKIDWRVGVFGTIVMLILMTVLVIFAKLAGQASATFYYPAVVFTWFCLLIFMATAALLFSSVFFNTPIEDFRTQVFGESRRVLDPDSPPRDEEKAKATEKDADGMLIEAIQVVACHNDPHCPTRVADPQQVRRVRDDKGMASFAFWQIAVKLAKDRGTIARLNAKISNPQKGVTCPPLQNGPCFVNGTDIFKYLGPPVMEVPNLYSRQIE
jgi:energy-coupling factor transporter transmembrane protein EcfT